MGDTLKSLRSIQGRESFKEPPDINLGIPEEYQGRSKNTERTNFREHCLDVDSAVER